MPDDMITSAEMLAKRAHEGQVDKSGAPYWTHPARVARILRELYPESPDSAVAAAWLHDVIEDTPVTEAELRGSFPAAVADAVVALTRSDAVEADAYYANLREIGGIALMVKYADITDNLDDGRLASLDPAEAARLREKYGNALESLSSSPDS